MTKKTTVPSSKKPRKSPRIRIKSILKKPFQWIDGILTIGAFIYDYGKKICKTVAVLLTIATGTYVAKEIPHRTEHDTIGSIVMRGVRSMHDDVNAWVRKDCPRKPHYKKEYPSKTNTSKKPVCKDVKKTEPVLISHWKPVQVENNLNWQEIQKTRV